MLRGAAAVKANDKRLPRRRVRHMKKCRYLYRSGGCCYDVGLRRLDVFSHKLDRKRVRRAVHKESSGTVHHPSTHPLSLFLTPSYLFSIPLLPWHQSKSTRSAALALVRDENALGLRPRLTLCTCRLRRRPYLRCDRAQVSSYPSDNRRPQPGAC